MTATEYYKNAHLKEAIAAAVESVKTKPGDSTARWFLSELLCFNGELERVDSHLDAIAMQEPDAALGAAIFRQLLRAEQARRQFFTEGRAPELLTPPTDDLRRRVEAALLLRTNELERAAAVLTEAESQRRHLTGTADGAAFSDFRDMDDLLAGVLEVLSPNGKYCLVPLECIERIEFRAPKRPRDLLWQPIELAVRDGPSGEVFMPALYIGAERDSDNQVRLGRMTDWIGSPLVRGRGRRTFLVGEEARSGLEMKVVEFASV
jgi:type VI secretion system protein ImpE